MKKTLLCYLFVQYDLQESLQWSCVKYVHHLKEKTLLFAQMFDISVVSSQTQNRVYILASEIKNRRVCGREIIIRCGIECIDLSHSACTFQSLSYTLCTVLPQKSSLSSSRMSHRTCLCSVLESSDPAKEESLQGIR